MVSLSSGGPCVASVVQTETLRKSPSSGLATVNSAKGTSGNGIVNGSNVSHALAPNIPLSFRRSQRLDLSTVERKGQKQSSHLSNKRTTSLHGLTEAPIFRPSEDEFRDPIEYIKSIAPQGRTYGIVKIIPPDNWNPDFAIDTEVRILALIAQHLLLVYRKIKILCLYKFADLF